MANKFQVKRTTTSGRSPNTTNVANTMYIDAGELALNLADGKMFTSNGSALVEFGTGTPVYDASGTLITNSYMTYVALGALATNVVPATDNLLTLGQISYRFAEGYFAANVFIGNTSVNTSISPSQIRLGGSVVANGSTGTAGQVLTSGGAGANAYWATGSGGGGGGTPGGSNTYVQFNDSGSLGGSGLLTFDKVASTLSVGNSTVNTVINSGNTTITTLLSVGNTIVNTAISPTQISISNTTSSMSITPTQAVIGNTTVSSTQISLGNTTVNTQITSTQVVVGNTTITSTQATLGGTVSANGGAGSAGQFLTSGGSGANAYWSTVTTVTPSGSNTQLQFNDSGAFGGDAQLTFNKTTDVLTVGNTGGAVVVGNSTINTSITPTQATLGGSVSANGGVGSAGQVLTSGGAGANAYWSTASGGSGTPGGSNTQIQFNNSGAFGGDGQFTFDATTDTVSVGNSTVNTIMAPANTVLGGDLRVTSNSAIHLGGTRSLSIFYIQYNASNNSIDFILT